MAKKEPSFNEKLQQENITEDEADQLRARGQGFEVEPRQASREPVEAHRRASRGEPAQPEDEKAMRERSVVHDEEAPRRAGVHGGKEQVAGHEGLLAQEGHEPDRRERTGDESLTEQERAAGRFETEGQPTQLEQDFGEIGRNMRGSIHDSAHEPSILDPDEE